MNPRTVSDLFPSKWLHPNDLDGRSFVLAIDHVSFDEFPAHPRSAEKTLKGIVHFTGAKKALVLNKTQAQAIAAIVGSESFADWTGHKILVAPGTAQNGKPTILINHPPNGDSASRIKDRIKKSFQHAAGYGGAATNPGERARQGEIHFDTFGDGSPVPDDLQEDFCRYCRDHNEQPPATIDHLIAFVAGVAIPTEEEEE